MNELLNFFKHNNVALQITLDIGKKPTVHAFFKGDNIVSGLHKTEGDTIEIALLLMKDKLFGTEWR